MTALMEYLNIHGATLLESWFVMNLQVAVFAGVIWILDSFLKSASPRLRYMLWMAALIKTIIPPVFSFPEASGVTESVFTLPAVTAALFAQPESSGLSVQGIIIVLLSVASLALAFFAVLRHIRLRLSLVDAVPYEDDLDPDVRWPRLLTSSRIFSPLATGLLKPKIYLTDEVAHGSSQVRRAVLYHELAHIRRGDRFVVILQTLLQIVYVLNPMVWLINLRLFRYRELICDEYAVKHAAMKPQDYGRLLLDFAERYAKPVIDMQIGTCFFETRKGFVQRISMLLSSKSEQRFSAKQVLLLIMAAALILPLSWQCSTRDEKNNVLGTDAGESALSNSSSDQGNLQHPGTENGSDERGMVDEIPPAIIGGMAQLQKNIVYPEEALKQGIEGTVVYEITIGADDHRVKTARIARSAHPLLDAAGIAAINATEFKAGRKAGKPVEGKIMVPIKFSLN